MRFSLPFHLPPIAGQTLQGHDWLTPLQARLATFDHWGDRQLLRFVSQRLFQPLASGALRHVVAHRKGSAADFVLTIPALSALRRAFPEASLTLLHSEGRQDGGHSLFEVKDVLAAFPGLVDRLIQAPLIRLRNRNALQALAPALEATGDIDLWVHFPAPWETCLQSFQALGLARLLKSRAALGFDLALPENFRPAYARAQAGRWLPHADWLVELLQAAGPLSASPGDYLARFQPPATWQPEQGGVDAAQPWLAVCVGAENPIHQWPLAHFQKTLDDLSARHPDLPMVLIGHAAHYEDNHRLLLQSRGKLINLTGQLDAGQLWSLLAQAHAVLANDSTVARMAALLEKPLFSPLSGQTPAGFLHAENTPGHGQRWRKATPCAPCFEKACPYADQPCLSLLNPETLYASLSAGLQAACGGRLQAKSAQPDGLDAF